jgi:hypothetical protein
VDDDDDDDDDDNQRFRHFYVEHCLQPTLSRTADMVLLCVMYGKLKSRSNRIVKKSTLHSLYSKFINQMNCSIIEYGWV